jgi:hypothetical protein
LKARYTYPREDGPFRRVAPSRRLRSATLVPLRCGTQSTWEDWNEATAADSLGILLILMLLIFGTPSANDVKLSRLMLDPGVLSLMRYGPAPIGVS